MSKEQKNKATEEENNKAEEQKVETTENNNTEAVETEKEPTAEDKIATLEADIAEQKDKYLRLFAEFDNYKKRTAKERIELINTAGKDVFLSIIPTLDDIERAIQSAEQATDVEAVKEGFLLVKNKMMGTLEQKGLKPMQSIGEDFNPDQHEALTKTPAPSAEQKGKVIDEIEKGYLLNNRIIRYAKVVVGE